MQEFGTEEAWPSSPELYALQLKGPSLDAHGMHLPAQGEEEAA